MDRIFFLLLSLSALYIAESSEVFINIPAFAVSRQHPGYCFHFGNWHLTITHVNHLNVISWDAPPVISCCLGLLLFQLRHLPSLNTSPNWRLPKEEGKNQSRLVSYSEESNSLQNDLTATKDICSCPSNSFADRFRGLFFAFLCRPLPFEVFFLNFYQIATQASRETAFGHGPRLTVTTLYSRVGNKKTRSLKLYNWHNASIK